MVRIRGSIGDWPVDLTLELDAEDWRQLAQHVPPPPLGEPQVAAARAPARLHEPLRLRPESRPG
ncbi:hypothetical protein DZ889_028175, partial [Pseudomonas aeruginosa]|nr:hypothetical protein [Pseudomonas aeruginosa]